MGLRDHESLGVRARYRELERFKRERVIASWQQPGAQRSTRVIRFLEELTITSGELAGQDFQVRGFQREFIKAVYREDKRGVRPVRTAVLSMGRKNGKTQLAAALALCALCGRKRRAEAKSIPAPTIAFRRRKFFTRWSP